MTNIMPTVKFGWLTIKHKVFVFRAGLRTRAPIWLLLIHDWSKFTPAEAPHYGRAVFGDKSDPAGFSRAWLHHQNSNPHHWEYWIPRTVHPGDASPGEPLPMPMAYVREMVADWLGATRAYDGFWPASETEWRWYQANRGKLRLHPDTAQRVAQVMAEVFPA